MCVVDQVFSFLVNFKNTRNKQIGRVQSIISSQQLFFPNSFHLTDPSIDYTHLSKFDEGLAAPLVPHSNNYYRKVGQMSERKAWSEVQDSILKDLYENKHIKRWSEIARIMETEYHIKGRNGKQCRERYHNHLDDSIKHEKWTSEEEQILAKHHDQLGNRWAELSKFLPGRSENDIKNQFYSILRRGLRHINSVIRRQLKRYKELEVDTLYKITDSSDAGGRRKGKGKNSQNKELKRTIMHYAFKTGQTNSQDAVSIKKFIEQVKSLGKTKHKKDQENEKEEEVNVKQEPEKESDEIESEQYRDNCPIVQVKKEPQKFRKNSFFNFTLEQPEVQVQTKTEVKSCPYKLRKKSSFYSNHSFDLSSPRWNELDNVFKALQMQQTDNFSPKPQFYATSPYFDQSKSIFWNPHEFH